MNIPISLIGETYIFGKKELKNLRVFVNRTFITPMGLKRGFIIMPIIESMVIEMNNGVMINATNGDNGEISE